MNKEEKLNWIIELLEAVLRNQMKLAKAIQFKEDIQIEYLDKENKLKEMKWIVLIAITKKASWLIACGEDALNVGKVFILKEWL